MRTIRAHTTKVSPWLTRCKRVLVQVSPRSWALPRPAAGGHCACQEMDRMNPQYPSA